MNIEQYENYMEKDYDNSYKNTNENCYINSNPINNYLNNEILYNSNNEKDNNSNYYNINHKSKKSSTNKHKKNKICNLNDPKLLQAYNEGYYGLNNVPKQYYIYPKFSNIELNKKTITSSNERKSYSSKNTISKQNYKDNNYDLNYDILYNKNKKNSINNLNNNISSYANYPYPRLINISSNIFGKFHLSNKNEGLINSNNKINLNGENNEKENLNENNINDIYNKTLDISLKIKDDKNIKLKGIGKIIQNEIGNENDITIKENNINENDKDNNLNYTGTFYYINNNITKRTLPYNNIPDNISIDDEEDD